MLNKNHAFNSEFVKFIPFSQVYDGNSTSALVLGKFCGTVVPEPVISTGNNMYIVFITDSSVTNKGFHASYRMKRGR